MSDTNAIYTEEQVAAMKAEIETSLRAKIEAEMKEKLSAEVETALKAQYEALIAKARSEEKDKLYPEISRLKEASEKAERERVIAQQEAEAKKAEMDAKITELTANLEKATKANADTQKENTSMDKKLVKELNDKLEKLTAQVAAADAEKAEAKKAAEIAEYRASQLKDLDETMHSFVKGTTKEEIDASVKEAKEAYEKLQKRLGGVPTPSPSAAKMAEALQKTSAEDINALRRSGDREAWLKSDMRAQLGLGNQGNRAMFKK